jgi:phosphatidylserine/phosphatidylglycerophosphate/cardiolipin synthase-like enzyme
MGLLDRGGHRRIRRPLRRDGVVLTAETPPAPRDDPSRAWLLTEDERGNPAARLPAWRTGNAVRPLVHGRTYFPVLAEALADAGPGDLVMFADWRGDPDQRLTDDGLTVQRALADAARRGALVKGLIWRSHLDRFRFSGAQNRDLSEEVNDAGGEVLLDQRVRPLGSHHQKFVVIRHEHRPERDVAFVGGIDLAHSRRDDADHGGDPQTQPFARWYGGSPAWHDVHLEIRGPAVQDVEDTFRERWDDPAALTRLPWHAVPDMVRRLDREASRLPDPLPPPPSAGDCTVQLLRTYPNRWPGYPFAPDGERSGARGYAKALRRARRLVYIEDQYLWSTDVAQVFADALQRNPHLHVIGVVPRYPEQDHRLSKPAAMLGHARAIEMVERVAPGRVLLVDIENHDGEPVYVHSKICVVDDVWAAVGSDNFNRRSWTHDSELTAAVVDERLDPRDPRDPGDLGDGARRFARDLRLELLREHLDRESDDDLLSPDDAFRAVGESARELDAWYRGGQSGPRPPGRVRLHHLDAPPRWQRLLAAPAYRALFDPDGRPPRMKLHGRH